jgi:hypothetical protein
VPLCIQQRRGEIDFALPLSPAEALETTATEVTVRIEVGAVAMQRNATQRNARTHARTGRKATSTNPQASYQPKHTAPHRTAPRGALSVSGRERSLISQDSETVRQ